MNISIVEAAKKTSVEQSYSEMMQEKIDKMNDLTSSITLSDKYKRTMLYTYKKWFEILEMVSHTLSDYRGSYNAEYVPMISRLIETFSILYKDDVLLGGTFQELCRKCNHLYEILKDDVIDEDKAMESLTSLYNYLYNEEISYVEYPKVIMHSVECLINLGGNPDKEDVLDTSLGWWIQHIFKHGLN